MTRDRFRTLAAILLLFVLIFAVAIWRYVLFPVLPVAPIEPTPTPAPVVVLPAPSHTPTPTVAPTTTATSLPAVTYTPVPPLVLPEPSPTPAPEFTRVPATMVQRG